ncbi:hypothetical protein C8Q72DRAFT_289735 [Fomitopsis betulina]|nr:hypothetical protein C8Q72DRAFT_289735 [Fomitopsis betulina]
MTQVSLGHNTASEVFAEIQAYVFLSNDMTWAATTVWCFDYLLTLDREIQYFWYSSWSLNKFLFLGYRYPPLLYILINIFAIPPWPSWQGYHRCGLQDNQRLVLEITPDCSCAIVLYMQMALSIASMISATLFAALRVFALFGRNRALLALVFLTGFLNPAILIYIFSRSIPAPVSSFQGCSLSITGGSTTSYEKWTIVARAASVLSDGIVLVLTTKKTYSKVRQSAGLAGHDTVLGTLLRDASVCFSLLCIMNIIGMGTARKTEFIQIIQIWISILTSVLLSRLAMDLRETAVLETQGTLGYEVTADTLQFAGVDRSLGCLSQESEDFRA